ncbi:hypothetical protein [Longimicrobium sp.]|uniref:hypothetical protein n=1 Tax=Longimicrobium sp. TaxID=2029185 RepID=UPI002BC47323|nr:hypothetical protein [Longimicrobium sp.]HSU12883.1 hypothetical protein [Longimicrobium sp.]
MRTTRYILAGIVLLTAAACGRSSSITAPDRPSAPRADGGSTYGSGNFAPGGTGTSTAQGDTATRIGNGTLGSGA